MNRERGFVLPVVMIIIALLSALFLFATREWIDWKKKDNLRLAMIQADYAAESGIAFMQRKLQEQPEDYSTLNNQIGSFQIRTSVWETESGKLIIQSIAVNRDGIQQTKTVEAEKNTLKIRRWLE